MVSLCVMSVINLLKEVKIKIYFYKNWRESGSYASPVQSVGKALLVVNTHYHKFQYIINKLALCIVKNRFESGKKYLVRIKDKNYINEIIANKTNALEFIKDILSDEGIIKEKTGRKLK